MLETICAISTPMGVGGISIIRLSGKDAYSIASKFFIAYSNYLIVKNIMHINRDTPKEIDLHLHE